MSDRILSARDLSFLLYEWLDVERMTALPRFQEHSRETFDGALELSRTLATRHFAPHNRRNDIEEPVFDDGRVVLNPAVAPALRAFADSGLLAAGMPAEIGGMQLPATVTMACFAWFQAANVGTAAYPFLTSAAINLLVAHGSPEQIDTYARPMLEGRWFGTMCLSEPQAGSSLADITVRAEPQDVEQHDDRGYRLFGNKMWISGGDHELTDNIVHLVLARVPGDAPGVKGLSLFLVPKRLVLADGQLGERNDVALAGLNHKMGYRGTTNTLLNFGEGAYRPGGRPGAVGFLVGGRGQGLAAMFAMMNEARVGVGVGAVALGTTGYLHALGYARERAQGRPINDRDPQSPQIPIIEHPDVRRMLLAAKSYVEGGMALSLYCAALLDESVASQRPEDRAAALQVLDVLTPIAKSWPSQWCLEANSLAIQIHGGYGYTRDYPVEQFYRDNRLNPIHEGTAGIQALDLLGRKVVQHDGAGLRLLLDRMHQTAAAAEATGSASLQGFAAELRAAVDRIPATTMTLWSTGDPDVALANAAVYLEAVGHIVVAWMWLSQLVCAHGCTGDFYDGKRAAGRYFFRFELPKVGPQLDLLDSLDRTTLDTDPRWL